MEKGFLGISQIFEARAKEHPGKVALVWREKSVTYAELNGAANYLAAFLSKAGVKHGDVVAIDVMRSVDVIVAILAVLKCGAAYLPVNRENPLSRNTFCLQVAKAKYVISDEIVDKFNLEGVLFLSTASREVFTSHLETFGSHISGSDDLAYIMFTSGSTGVPKGVAVPHRAVTRLVIETNYVSIKESDCVLQGAPLSFDASTFEIWAPLLNGATLALYSGEVFDPTILRRDIGDHKVSILWLTAALFHIIAEYKVEVLASLRILLAGGDVLSPRHINKVLDNIPDIVVINGYGPTENTTFTCCHAMTIHNRPNRTVPVGKPIRGTDVHILDEHRARIKKGEVGELYTSGLGVALGYINADAEDHAFFADPSIAPGLIYRTGDLVRENISGDLEFIGRRDNQIKNRGYRINLDEVKSSLLQIANISDVVVVRKDGSSGEQLLAAYIKLENRSSMTGERIREILSSKVPGYMVPDQFIFQETLPVNINGKIDRHHILSHADQ